MLSCLLPVLLIEKLRYRVEEGPARHWQSKEFRSPSPDLSPLFPLPLIPNFITLITSSSLFYQVNQDNNQVQQVTTESWYPVPDRGWAAQITIISHKVSIVCDGKRNSSRSKKNSNRLCWFIKLKILASGTAGSSSWLLHIWFSFLPLGAGKTRSGAKRAIFLILPAQWGRWH